MRKFLHCLVVTAMVWGALVMIIGDRSPRFMGLFFGAGRFVRTLPTKVSLFS